jgi:hypothetical protein
LLKGLFIVEPVTLVGIDIAIVAGGKLVEEWNVWEQLQAPEPQPDADRG